MRTEPPQAPLAKIEEVQRADKRVDAAKRRLLRARRELGVAQRRALRRAEYRGGQKLVTRTIVEDRETTLRAAEKDLDTARAERRREAARKWEEVAAALGEEYRCRVGETVDAVANAVEANRRLRELNRKAEELLPQAEVRRGFLRFDVCWPELNDERFEQWVRFLSLIAGLDMDELRKAK
jgi:hypothetical protein